MKKILLALAFLLIPLTCQAASQGKLNLYAAGTDLDKIMSAFTKETGIEVSYLEMSSGEVLTRLRASNGKPQADVWYGGGLDSFIAAAQEKLLQAYKSPERIDIPLRYKDNEGMWTGVTMGAVEIMVNSRVLEEKDLPMPESWTDLGKDVYKGEVLMATPAVSGTFYFMVAELLEEKGLEEGWSLLESIDKNVPYYSKRGAEPANKVSSGEAAIAVAPYDTGVKLRAQGYPLKSVMPADGTPWYFSPVAILDGAENTKEAKIFVDWILSEDGQTVIGKYAPPMPVREDIKVTDRVQEMNNVKFLQVNMVKIGEKRQYVLDEWQKRFGDK